MYRSGERRLPSDGCLVSAHWGNATSSPYLFNRPRGPTASVLGGFAVRVPESWTGSLDSLVIAALNGAHGAEHVASADTWAGLVSAGVKPEVVVVPDAEGALVLLCYSSEDGAHQVFVAARPVVAKRRRSARTGVWACLAILLQTVASLSVLAG